MAEISPRPVFSDMFGHFLNESYTCSCCETNAHTTVKYLLLLPGAAWGVALDVRGLGLGDIGGRSELIEQTAHFSRGSVKRGSAARGLVCPRPRFRGKQGSTHVLPPREPAIIQFLPAVD